MKRIIIWTLVLCLLACSAACTRHDDEPDEPTAATVTEAPQKPDTPENAPTEAPTEAPAPADTNTYRIVKYEVASVSYEGDLLKEVGMDETSLTLNDDHTGTLLLTGEPMDIGWTDDGSITISGIPFYTFERVDANTILLKMFDATFTMKRGAAQVVEAPTPEPVNDPAPDNTVEPDETEAPPVVTEAPAASAGGEVTIEGKIGWSTKVPVTVNLPSGNWCAVGGSKAYFYNVPDESKAYSDTPRVQFEFKESEDKINFYVDEFENLKSIDSRTIGGVQMVGRTYRNVGMEWVEFYGQLAEGCWVSVKLSGVDYSAGSEADKILNSAVFGTPHE